MKRLLGLLVTVILILTLATAAWAEGTRAGIDYDILLEFNMTDVYSSTFPGVFDLDNWYSIQDKSPEIKANVFFAGDTILVGPSYYQNDQTFVKFEYSNIDSSTSYFNFSGSYLFNFGLFAQLTGELSDDPIFVISPGYRFSFGEKNYMALRADLVEGELINFCINGKYFTDQLYLRGRFTILPEEGFFYSLAANYQVNDSLVTGLALLGFDEGIAYELGCTWKPLEKLTLDTKLGSDTSQDSYFVLSGMYQITDGISAGAQYDSTGIVAVKSRLNLDKHQLTLVVGIPSPDALIDDTLYSLTYHIDL